MLVDMRQHFDAVAAVEGESGLRDVIAEAGHTCVSSRAGKGVFWTSIPVRTLHFWKGGAIRLKKVNVENAVGLVLAHDITEIIPGKKKDVAFRRGTIIEKGDVERLLDWGRAIFS